MFQKYRIRYALIGGFALHAAGYTRATQDIDILVRKEDGAKVKRIMESFGYKAVHESEDVSNYVGKIKPLGQVDFIHAHRQYARQMLEQAKDAEILNRRFKVKVVRPEDIIGLKVQSSSNQPERYHQDMADIEHLIRANRDQLEMNLLREYFDLFDRGRELNDILERFDDARG